MSQGRPACSIKIQVEITDDQERDFTACADACGVPLARWIVEVAAVKAADVVDALQAPTRKADRQRSRQRNEYPKSGVLERAMSYNAKFNKRDEP